MSKLTFIGAFGSELFVVAVLLAMLFFALLRKEKQEKDKENYH